MSAIGCRIWRSGGIFLIFLMFAHGYEFDFGTKESNWDKFERICRNVAEAGNITCCSIGEALRSHERKGASGRAILSRGLASGRSSPPECRRRPAPCGRL